MKLKKFATATALTATLIAGGGAFADVIPVTPTFSPGTTLNTTALSNITVSGSAMAGMSVKAYFSDGSSETATWAAGVAPAGAASGTNWSLGFAFLDTFNLDWVLFTGPNLASPMTRLVIDGQPGDTIFDTVVGPETTPTSAFGNPFSGVRGPSGLSLSAAYTNEVALDGKVYGDLYAVLDIGFGTGLAKSSELLFRADTDKTAIRGDLNPLPPLPPIQPVPEPASAALLGLGLVGLAFRRRKA